LDAVSLATAPLLVSARAREVPAYRG
jgi:hypothetical protein